MTAPISGTSSATSTLPLSSSSGSSSASGSGSSSSTNPLAGMNDSLSQSDFMQLLVAQMTHQDPTAPTDDTAMAAELAQFAALSQLTSINSTLSSQSSSTGDLATSVNNSAAINLIGKTVTAQSSQIAVGTDATTSVSTTPTASGDLVLNITDANGNTVGTKDLGQVTSGTNQTVQLAGMTNGLASGAYNVQFTLTDSAGNVTNPAASITATVTGVSFSSGAAEVTSGPLTIPIGSIASVTSN